MEIAPLLALPNSELQAFISGFLDSDLSNKSNRNKESDDYFSIESSNESDIECLKKILPLAGFYILREEAYIKGEDFITQLKITSRIGPRAKKAYEVASIIEDSEEDVWCLEVEEDHSFTLKNGVVTGNCTVIYGDKISFLGNAFYLLLCGCGVGANLMTAFTKRLSRIQKRNKGTLSYIIEDSIEGWAKAAHVLVSSYAEVPVQGYEDYQGYKIRFDYSIIREKGASITGKFKAPGAEGIKQSFEKIEILLDGYVEDQPKEFKGILAYDTFMHLSDAVLSGGVRRAACSIICSPDDTDLIYAKTGNWREINKQRARSNNSVGLIRGKFTKEDFKKFLELNRGVSDIGFVFMNHIYENMNPCFEIGFTAIVFDWANKEIIARVLASDETLMDEGLLRTAIQCCNLNEINGGMVKTEKDFYYACEQAAVTGTLQAGYTDFLHLEEVLEDTIAVTRRESLLGVSVTGWTNSPFLFNAEILQKGAAIVKETNKKIANILGINPAARTTCCKPSGNSCTPFYTGIKTERGIMTLGEIFNYCLSEEIEHNSLLPKTYAIPKNPLKVYDENNELKDVSSLYVNGFADLYEIEFEDGNVYKFTGNHKLKTSSGWKKVEDITEDDEIISF